MDSFGEHIKLTTFGESHSAAIGGVIEGFPAGVEIDPSFIQSELDRRKPSNHKASTTRKESDRIEILSGIFEGKTLGTPIAFIIRNKKQRSGDYEYLREIYRPGHADFTYDKKYGHYDHRSGGRASARETAARVAAGAFAKTILQSKGIEITAFVDQIGIAQTLFEMENLLELAKAEGDSLGGIVKCVIKGCPAGIGEPVFGKLQAQLAEAMMTIPAAKGFEYGKGFDAAKMKGSEHNDAYIFDSLHPEYFDCAQHKLHEGTIKPATNHSGGILGGISTGQDIVFRVAFKPVASISKPQETADKQGKTVKLVNRGRHDVCCVPRAVPVVEAMAALVIANHLKL
jgi:chorismate synthase